MPDIIKSLRKVPLYAIKKLAGTVVGVSTDRPVIALTFDDGPHPRFTSDLLDILKKYNARATFFMVGTCAATPGHCRKSCPCTTRNRQSFVGPFVPAPGKQETADTPDSCM